MKNIAAQMVNFDCEQMRRIANNMPEQYDEKPQVQQVAQIINGVFSQLLATFPASLANRDQNELNEIRRQWVLAFRENGITTMEQVNAGMRVARRQNRPFLPSPGQFVAWCRKKHLLTPGCQTSASWLIWFTSIAGSVACIRMQSLIRGNRTRITGWLPTCTRTCGPMR
ncbi:Replication protein P [Escherichia coli]|nr:Replication protein P [Escherichia coli]